jgi:hypothetical protein
VSSLVVVFTDYDPNLIEASVLKGWLFEGLTNLAEAEQKFAEAMAPIEALRAWMLLFVDYIAAKQIIAPALNTIVGGPSKLFEATDVEIKGAIHALVERAIENDDIRPVSILSICSGLLSASPTSRLGRTGRKAHEDSWRYLSSVRGLSLRAAAQRKKSESAVVIYQYVTVMISDIHKSYLWLSESIGQ